MATTNTNTVMKVLDSLEKLPGICDGKHRIVIHGGSSKNWWDNTSAVVQTTEITAKRINLYI
jgi:hypothetical protein